MKSWKLIGLFLLLFPVWGFAQPNADMVTAEKFRKEQKIDSAAVYYQKAAAKYREQKNTEAFIDAYNQIGIMRTRQDRYVDAKKFLHEALFASSDLEKNSLTVAATYLGLGVVYAAEDNFKQSLIYHQKALEIRLAKLGENHADVATCYGNIGNVHYRSKNYDGAIDAHLKALDIRKKVFGESANELTQSYTNLGNAYREKKEYQTALDYFDKALRNKMVQVGDKHKELRKFYENIRDVHYLMNDKAKGDLYDVKAKEL